MSIINKLDDINIKFTKSEKQLINYIKADIKEVSYKSISDIAKESNVGEATITRFAKKLGFSGFPDFKISLAQEVIGLDNKNIIDNNIDNVEHANETGKKLLHNNIYVLEQTSQIINYDDIHRCSDIIKNSNKIFFIGVGYSGIIAQDINYKFLRIGINCNYFSDSHSILIMCSILQEGDTVVCISHTGETDEIIKGIEIAKQNKANIISITKDGNSKAKSLSDVSLSYLSNESILETGSMYSKLGQLFLLDLVYTQVVKDMGKIALDNKVKTTQAIKEKYKSTL